MQNSVISYPRIGASRELKFGVEKYFSKQISQEELLTLGKNLRKTHFEDLKSANIDFIPCNDFSFYDTTLDTAVLFNVVASRYKNLNLNTLDEYFAQARGYQGEKGDEKALAMKKWFNTNYHYIEPECDNADIIDLVGDKIFKDYEEAKTQGIEPKLVIHGIFTFYKLIRFKDQATKTKAKEKLLDAYSKLLIKLNELNVLWLSFDEPYLVFDLQKEDLELFNEFYINLLSKKGKVKILLQTYFGDIRDAYENVLKLEFDGIGLDFIEGNLNLDLLKKFGFDQNKILFAGIINGRNIYKNNYKKSLNLLHEIQNYTSNIVINTSCSLLHVPYTTQNEGKLEQKYLEHFAFAKEKLQELQDLKTLCKNKEFVNNELFIKNQALFNNILNKTNPKVQEATKNLNREKCVREPQFAQRKILQQEILKLPLLPTTTIGSFPQTKDVRSNRLAFKQNKITANDYKSFNQSKIKECIKIQEEIGLDVLVHGEFERNDMVEYFGENLEGFLFTQNAWVQSYGTRCVKPPVIWGDVSRKKAITVEYAKFAQAQSKKIVKGMLTGPVTILNWSFPREDISLRESALQIALAIQEEVLDLENAGIKIIQIDEAALREKLPLRKSEWKNYLEWAILAFNVTHYKVKAQTQIHTHMCYSEFSDIIKEIDALDADVISFEASRSNLDLLNALKEANFKTDIGPGIYDIHSPRIPSVEELKDVIRKILSKFEKNKIWINPDCGLKTRNYEEVIASLKNLVQASKDLRKEIQ